MVEASSDDEVPQLAPLAENKEQKREKTKVIVVSGFLGAGKTTMIESILKAPKLDKKVCVIQNEFSKNMGLENSMMKDA